MSAKSGGVSSGTRIVQTTKTASASNGLWQLWKIQYLSNGQYSIRPLHKSDMGINGSSSPALANIGTTDTYASVNSYARWSINWTTNGYTLKNDARSGYALCTSSSTTDGAYNDFSVNGAISNNIDFMIYIGHGHSTHNAMGNHIQYSHATDGTVDITYICDNEAYTQTQKDKFCVYANEVNFGSSTSDLRWVWMYTCNFLHTKEDNNDADSNPSNDNDYVTNAMLVEMMTGAHIVMGYASRSTLCDAMAEDFATYLRNGDSIYDAYFKAGHTGEGSVETKNHYQKILYIPQARYETIYSPQVRYQYDTSDVRIVKRNIHDDY